MRAGLTADFMWTFHYSTNCCLFLLVTCLLTISSLTDSVTTVTNLPMNNSNGSVQLSYDQWVYAALKSQSILTLNVPLSEVGLCGSWHSANAPIYHSLRYEALFNRKSTNVKRRYCSSSGLCLNAVGTFKIADQVGGIEWQLNLGIRRFHFELHHVSHLSPSIRICKSEKDLCDQIKNSFYQMAAHDFASTDDPCWGIVGVDSSDASTGCDGYSLSWSESLKKLRTFLSDNPSEVVLVQVDSSSLDSASGVCRSNDDIEGPISGSFGSAIFKPSDLNSYRSLRSDNRDSDNPLPFTGWPSAQYLAAVDKRIIIISDCTFSGQWIHDTSPQSSTAFLPLVGEITSAKRFRASRCAYLHSSGALASLSNHFGGVYEDRSALNVRITSDRGEIRTFNYHNGPASSGQLTTRKATDALNCGFSPLLAHVDMDRVSACVWMWADGNSSLCGENLCTAMQVDSNPEAHRLFEWINIDCSTSLPLACKHQADFGGWQASRRSYEFPVDDDLTEVEGCPMESSFETPLSPGEANRLASSMIGNRIKRVWLKYISPVTCHPTRKNPPELYTVSGQLHLHLPSGLLLFAVLPAIFIAAILS